MSQGFTGQVNTNALNAPFFNGGRLTCVSGSPVADATNVGTIYWTPYKSGTISLYNGTNYQTIIASETSLTLTGASSAASGSVYDVFGYLSGTVMVLESLVWTNTTTRATAVNQDSFGVYSKSTDRTRRYLGTFYASGTNQITDSTSIRGLWNMDNAEPRRMYRMEGTDSWTYTSTAWRQANNSTSNQLAVVTGLTGRMVVAEAMSGNINGSGNYAGCGIGINSTSTNSAQITLSTFDNESAYIGATFETPGHAELYDNPAIGYSYYAWLESSYRTTGTTTWYGDAGDTTGKLGLGGMVGWTVQ